MMRTIIQALDDLLDPRVVQRGPLVLREDDPGSTCPPTTIMKSERVVALRFGERESAQGLRVPVNRWLFPLLKDDAATKACRSCDYILFHSSREPTADDSLYVMLCELKSGRGGGASQQLRNGKLIAEYLLNVVWLLGKVETWPAQTHYRGIIFAGNSPGAKAVTGPAPRASYRRDTLCKNLLVTSLRPGNYHLQYFCV